MTRHDFFPLFLCLILCSNQVCRATETPADATIQQPEVPPMEEFLERIQWLGHDGILITGKGVTLLIDPYKLTKPRPADLILITHDHFDHFSPEDIEKCLKPDTLVIGPPETIKKLTRVKTHALTPGEKLARSGVLIQAVPSYNTNKQFHPKTAAWMGYLVHVDNLVVYHAGDTDRIPEMKSIRCDVALLPISGTYVMTPEEAAQAVLEDLKPRVAIPIHYGTVVGTDAMANQFEKLLEGKIRVVIKNPPQF